MKTMTCQHCGASDFKKEGSTLVCKYCDSTYLPNTPRSTATIDLSSDIQRLLQKCKDDPQNARRYANLVLDIDPDNKDAKNFLVGRFHV